MKLVLILASLVSACSASYYGHYSAPAYQYVYQQPQIAHYDPWSYAGSVSHYSSQIAHVPQIQTYVHQPTTFTIPQLPTIPIPQAEPPVITVIDTFPPIKGVKGKGKNKHVPPAPGQQKGGKGRDEQQKEEEPEQQKEEEPEQKKEEQPEQQKQDDQQEEPQQEDNDNDVAPEPKRGGPTKGGSKGGPTKGGPTKGGPTKGGEEDETRMKKRKKPSPKKTEEKTEEKSEEKSEEKREKTETKVEEKSEKKEEKKEESEDGFSDGKRKKRSVYRRNY